MEKPAKLVDVGLAYLHSNLFLNGKNFGTTLDLKKTPDLSMGYDRKEKELIVAWKGTTAYIPATNVSNYQPGPAPERNLSQTVSPVVANISHTAQVETPSGHVFKGPGAGKSR